MLSRGCSKPAFICSDAKSCPHFDPTQCAWGGCTPRAAAMSCNSVGHVTKAAGKQPCESDGVEGRSAGIKFLTKILSQKFPYCPGHIVIVFGPYFAQIPGGQIEQSIFRYFQRMSIASYFFLAFRFVLRSMRRLYIWAKF